MRPKPLARISSASVALKLEFEAPMPTNPNVRWPTGAGDKGSDDASSVTSSSKLMPRLSVSRRRQATTLSESSSVTNTRTSYPPGLSDGPRGHFQHHPSIRDRACPSSRARSGLSPSSREPYDQRDTKGARELKEEAPGHHCVYRLRPLQLTTRSIG